MANGSRVTITLACTECGDRINQIVFIGKEIDETAIRKKLNQCIYTGQDGVCNA